MSRAEHVKAASSEEYFRNSDWLSTKGLEKEATVDKATVLRECRFSKSTSHLINLTKEKRDKRKKKKKKNSTQQFSGL